MEKKISYQNEVYRKLIHLSSLWMPMAIYQLERIQAVILFAFLLAIITFFEYVRRKPGQIGHAVSAIFAPILRQHEKKKGQYTGAAYVVLAALLCSIFFPKIIAVTALCIMLVCDTAASLVGRKWGKTPLFKKSLEGFMAFIVSGLVVMAVLHKMNFDFPTIAIGMVAVITAGCVELFSVKMKIDDNLSVTIAAATTLWALF
jgi:dolichol kinase